MDGTPNTVNDVMTRRVLALRTGAGFKDIVGAMREWRVGAVPVLDDAGPLQVARRLDVRLAALRAADARVAAAVDAGAWTTPDTGSASSPRRICCPRRSTATATSTGTAGCATSLS